MQNFINKKIKPTVKILLSVFAMLILLTGVSPPGTPGATIEATLVGLEELHVGVPAIGEVRFTLTGATFAQDIFTSDFHVRGLPPGLTAAPARRVSDYVVAVLITGSPTQARESSTEITVSPFIPGRNFVRGAEPLTVSAVDIVLPPILPSALLHRQEATFDLNPANTALHRDIEIRLHHDGHGLRNLMYGNYRLVPEVDFVTRGDYIFLIRTHFLRQLPVGDWPLTFDMRIGESPQFTLSIVDSRQEIPTENQPGGLLDSRLVTEVPPLNEMLVFLSGANPVATHSLNLSGGLGRVRPVIQNNQASLWLRADVLEHLAFTYPGAFIEATTRLGTLRFPTDLLDILRDARAAIFGQSLATNQVYVRITFTDQSNDEGLHSRVQHTFPGGEVLAPLVDLRVELMTRATREVFFVVQEFTRPLAWTVAIMPQGGVVRYGAFWFNPSPARLEFAPHNNTGAGEVVIRSIYPGVHGVINNGELIRDVNFGHWGFERASTAAQKGLIQAVGGNISPNHSISRAEFVQLLSLALQLPSPGILRDFYQDVAYSSWSFIPISRAFYAGLLDGEEIFRPGAPILREEMIGMIALALTHGQPVITPVERPLPQYFVDYRDISIRFYLDLQSALNHGIFVGFGDTTARPGAEATRMEAIAMIVRMAEVLGNIDAQ